MTSGPHLSVTAGGGGSHSSYTGPVALLGCGLSGCACGLALGRERSRLGCAVASDCGEGVEGAAADFWRFGLKAKTGLNREKGKRKQGKGFFKF
jgi:hypothetical protein